MFGKYLQVLKVTFEEYFIYRLNFVLWRFRTITSTLMLYFLWQAALPAGVQVFNYDQAKILTYVLGVSLIRSLVLSSRSGDVAGEIASGNLANLLLKPINYLKYWFVKDLVDKSIGLFFSVFEFSIIIFLLKPPIIVQSNFTLWGLTILAVILGMFLYFYLSFLLSLIAFWTPENPWPPRFLFSVVLEFFAGGLFPLDILPAAIFSALKFLPFPYLLFFPLNVYLGKLSSGEILFGFIMITIWVVILSQIVNFAFKGGLKNYSVWGR